MRNIKAAIACTAVLIAAVANADIVERASVIDVNTIEIHGQQIRLHGVDAPEKGQPCYDAAGQTYRCGTIAARALDQFIGDSRVTCRERTTERYGRTGANGEDEASTLRNGWSGMATHSPIVAIHRATSALNRKLRITRGACGLALLCRNGNGGSLKATGIMEG